MASVMKEKIHPVYHSDATITCACGNVIKTGSTREKMEVEICSKCHPFYTGQEGRMLDTAGRVEKFKARKAATTTKAEKKPRVKKESNAKKIA